ncbi:hypothetical protein ACFLZN_00260 [Nanoarchaeota archaeon]
MEPILRHRYTGKEQITIIKYSVLYRDVFSLNGFVGMLRQWLIDNEYVTGDDSSFPEVFYLQRENPQLGKQIQLRWRLQKIPEDAKLWRYDFDIDIDVRGMKEVEFMHKGKKWKADKGEIEVGVVGNLVIDYENAWKNHKWLKRYKDFIIKNLLRNKFNGQKAEVHSDGEKLQNIIKEYLKLQSYETQLQDFWPKRPPD